MRILPEKPSALVVMAPLRQGRADELRAALQGMPNGEHSPFARVPSTHFARLTLIPALLDGYDEPVEPQRSYLLFSADFDGCRRRWLRSVAEQIGSELDPVLGHCEGYPGSGTVRDFAAFLRRHSVGVGFSVISYDATVSRIAASLELQRKLRAFAGESSGLNTRELQSAWRDLQRDLGRRFAV